MPRRHRTRSQCRLRLRTCRAVHVATSRRPFTTRPVGRSCQRGRIWARPPLRSFLSTRPTRPHVPDSPYERAGQTLFASHFSGCPYLSCREDLDARLWFALCSKHMPPITGCDHFRTVGRVLRIRKSE